MEQSNGYQNQQISKFQFQSLDEVIEYYGSANYFLHELTPMPLYIQMQYVNSMLFSSIFSSKFIGRIK